MKTGTYYCDEPYYKDWLVISANVWPVNAAKVERQNEVKMLNM